MCDSKDLVLPNVNNVCVGYIKNSKQNNMTINILILEFPD